MMKQLVNHCIRHYCPLVVLLVLVLPALATSQELPSRIVLYTRSGLIAAVPGQTLRVTFANLSAANSRETLLEPLSVLVELCDADGEVIAERESAAVRPGQFLSFDFNRDMIEQQGESGTGRLQMLVKVSFRFRVSNELQGSINQEVLEGCPVSVELIDDTTGRTRVLFTKLSLKREFPRDL